MAGEVAEFLESSLIVPDETVYVNKANVSVLENLGIKILPAGLKTVENAIAIAEGEKFYEQTPLSISEISCHLRFKRDEEAKLISGKSH